MTTNDFYFWGAAFSGGLGKKAEPATALLPAPNVIDGECETIDAQAELLCEDETGAFWWPMCTSPGCSNCVTHDSETHCYPHSRWYRPLLVPVNKFLSLLGW